MNARILLFFALFSLHGCEAISPFISDHLWNTRLDVDRDGIPRPKDCDDRDPNIGVRTWFRDVDQDGFGAGQPFEACSEPSGATVTNTDCDDTRATVFPGGPELCDNIDNDCNQKTDEAFPDLNASCGTGACAGGVQICTGDKSGTICSTKDKADTELCDNIDNDCDDKTDESFANLGSDCGTGACAGGTYVCAVHFASTVCSTDNQSATELCDNVDNDCNGTTDEPFLDLNASCGTGACAGGVQICTGDKSGTICSTKDKSDTEICDTIDNDCDGETDEGTLKTFYKDEDGDTYGNVEKIRIGCTALPKEVATSSDCNDTNGKIYPKAPELCNTLDDDCDGQTDEGVLTQYFKDLDGDKCAHASSPGIFDQTILACSAPTGYIQSSEQTCNAAIGDCNDLLSNVYAGATEFCDGVDNNCNAQTDEQTSVDAKTLYADVDQDGYGNVLVTKKSCQMESGWSLTSDDCHDLNGSVHPDQPEICNQIDDNCNMQTDETVLLLFYLDADNDSFGSALNTKMACTKPAGYSANATDCKDDATTVFPGATELCDNLIDDNCDGTTDNAPAAQNWYPDTDADGFGAITSPLLACIPPSGYQKINTDCDDQNSTIHPDALEVCKDDADNNCNGITDTDTEFVTWYKDADNDGFGNAEQSVEDCAKPNSHVDNADDCLDTNTLVHPDASEVCNNGIDDNCDGSVNACLFSGDLQITDLSTIQLTGAETQGFAASVAFCDINLDGHTDILIGSPNWNANQGKISLYLWPLQTGKNPDHDITGASNGLFGSRIDCTTVSELPFLLIGSPGDGTGGNSAGALFLFKGELLTASSHTDAEASWFGTAKNMRLGNACEFTPDQNNDTKDDIFVAANGYSTTNGSFAGAGFILDSATNGTAAVQASIASLFNETNDELAGSALTSGNFLPNGNRSFVLGAPSSDTASTDAGAVYLGTSLLTQTSLPSGGIALYGSSAFDLFGHSLASGVDLSGDAQEDLLIGAPGNANTQNTGIIYVAHWDEVTSAFLTTSLHSTIVGDQLGYAVSTGYIDAGTAGDILIGAPGSDDTGLNVGTVFLQYGPVVTSGNIRTTAHARIQGEAMNNQFGFGTYLSPDLTGDGIADLIVVAKSTKPLRKLYLIPGRGM